MHLLTREEWERALASHCISLDAAQSLAALDAEAFLATRQETLERQFATFLQQRCEWDFEDTPSLDSLVLDDEDYEDESRELSDDESSRH